MAQFLRLPAFLQEDAGMKTPFTANVKTSRLTRKMIFDMLALYDVLAIVASAWLSYYIYLVLFLHTSVEKPSYLVVIASVSILFHTIARQSGQYERQQNFSFASQLSALIYICAVTIASAFVMLFFLKIQTEFSRIWLVVWMALLLLLLAAGRAIAAQYIDILMRKGMLRRNVVLVGSGDQFKSTMKSLQDDEYHFCLVNALELSECNAYDSSGCSDNSPEMQTFVREAQDKHVDAVIIALPSAKGKELEKIVQQVQMLAVDVQILPDFGGANIALRHLHQVANLSLITTVSKPISEWGAFLKIIEDYIVGIFCLILFLPVMAIIAMAIKLDSDGPILFRQRRHGYNHQVIEVLKFRTMTVLEDGDVIKQATKNDRRITRVGAFLRRTSLDELPQFWNIVRGEMSVVGPRPHALAHNTYYGKLIENYANRHRVKPGITGWAQVHGFRGETTDPDMMARRVRYDLEYIENWSIWLDLKIVIMTPLFGLFRRSAY